MSPAEVAAEAASAFADRAGRAIASGARFAVAVPGGSVALEVFPRLADLAIDWSQLDVTWVDERVVGQLDPDSNLRVARDMWLDRLRPPGPRVLPPPVALGAPDQVAEAWQRAIVAALGTPPRLDLAILGVGPDGHVASLFPGHRGLSRLDAWAAGITDAPKPPPARVTLTRATLRASREIWFVAFGAEKAAALAEARWNPTSTLPAAIVAREAAKVRWFLDTDADGG
jgi:6-phosphogluconolactonase